MTARVGRISRRRIAPDVWKQNNNYKHPVITALVLTYLPLQPRRKLGRPGGSAAKVFEPLSQKTNLKQQKRGEFFAAHSSDSIFGVSGLLGSPFLWLLSFGDAKESD